MTFFYTFFIMCGFWLLLSGRFDLFHLSLGVISCLLVSYFSHDLLFQDKEKRNGRLSEAFRFVQYIPWLLYEITLANYYISYLALNPRMSELIDPKIIRFKTKLRKDISLVTFANSITLTPGTITIRIVDGDFFVYAISKETASNLPGEMEERIAKIFEGDS